MEYVSEIKISNCLLDYSWGMKTSIVIYNKISFLCFQILLKCFQSFVYCKVIILLEPDALSYCNNWIRYKEIYSNQQKIQNSTHDLSYWNTAFEFFWQIKFVMLFHFHSTLFLDHNDSCISLSIMNLKKNPHSHHVITVDGKFQLLMLSYLPSASKEPILQKTFSIEEYQECNQHIPVKCQSWQPFPLRYYNSP